MAWRNGTGGPDNEPPGWSRGGGEPPQLSLTFVDAAPVTFFSVQQGFDGGERAGEKSPLDGTPCRVMLVTI